MIKEATLNRDDFPAPRDGFVVTQFLVLEDIEKSRDFYANANFLTPPQDRGAETRAYIQDPDGHLIEVGEATGMLEMFDD